MILGSAHSAFAQVQSTGLMPLNGYGDNPKLDITKETALEYRYQKRDWSLPRYIKDSLTGKSRWYLSGGYGLNQTWNQTPKSDFNSVIVGIGYNFSPVHSVEFDANFNGDACYISTTYYMNLNNAALRRDAHNRFEVLLGAGFDSKVKMFDMAEGFSTSLRGRLNITNNFGLYVEPKASFSSPLALTQSGSGAHVATSVNFGAQYRFGTPAFYISDYVLPRALRNPARLDVPYEFDVLPLFAVKSNLLFDLATAINVAVEVPIGNTWSVNGEWMFPWWITDDATTAFQLLSANLEGRYWLGNRDRRELMTGFFAGFYLGGGLYDFRRFSKGYQGEFYIASGLSAGFAHTVNSTGSLRMEYAVGAGYLNTDYRYYEGRADNRFMVWQYNGRYTWLGPTRASVSLVWLWHYNRKRRGEVNSD